MIGTPRRFIVFGFASVHDALGAEAVLKAARVPATTIPAPRELGDLCGIALRIDPMEEEHAVRALTRGGASPRSRAEIFDI